MVAPFVCDLAVGADDVRRGVVQTHFAPLDQALDLGGDDGLGDAARVPTRGGRERLPVLIVAREARPDPAIPDDGGRRDAQARARDGIDEDRLEPIGSGLGERRRRRLREGDEGERHGGGR